MSRLPQNRHIPRTSTPRWGDKAAACLKKGMNSSYKELLTDKMGIEYAPYIEYYGKIRELTELNRREQELLREYDKLAGDFTVELEGGQWSYSRLEREPAGTCETTTTLRPNLEIRSRETPNKYQEQ